MAGASSAGFPSLVSSRGNQVRWPTPVLAIQSSLNLNGFSSRANPEMAA
jgi:hypothetical protein